MLHNKKGYSTGFAFIVVIGILFVCGLIYLLFNQVFTVHLMPSMGDLALNTMNASQITEFNTQSNIYLKYFMSIPFIIVFVLIVYLITNTMRRTQNEIQ